MNTPAPPPPKVRSEKEIISGLQSTVSASRLSLFLSCRLKFFFRYVLELNKAKTPALHVGSSVHSVLKQWSKSRWLGKPLTLKEVHDVFSTSWTDDSEGKTSWESKDEEEEEKITAWRLIDLYLRETPIPQNQKPEGVEVSCEVDLNQHGLPKLVGILDLIQNRRIIDFKTASSTPNADKVGHLHEVQTTTYALLYRDATGQREQGIDLHHLVKLKNPKLCITSLPPMRPEQQTRLFHLMDSYGKALERRDFVPSPSVMCHSCEFFHECRKWS